jgi:hypothetical protein
VAHKKREVEVKHKLLVIVSLVFAVASGCARSRAELYMEGHENAVAKTKFAEYATLNSKASRDLDIHNQLSVPASFKLVINDAPDAWLFWTVDPESQSERTVPDFEYRLQVFIGDLQDKELYYESSLFSINHECTITVYEVDRWVTKGLVDPFVLSEMNSDDFWR